MASFKKRFISGAQCPKCGAMDTVYTLVQSDSGELSRHCSRCDFSDAMSSDAMSSGAKTDEAGSGSGTESSGETSGEWQPVKLPE